jgi:TolA-binding protein
MAQDQPVAPVIRPRRRWVWPVLLALVIFVSGVLVGGGLTFKIITSGLKRSFQDPEVSAERITNRMKKRLDLTEEQVVQVRRIILERQKAFQSMRKQVRPQLEAQIEKTRQELAAVLSPEQARKWEKRFGRFLKFWLPPQPGDPPPDS